MKALSIITVLLSTGMVNAMEIEVDKGTVHLTVVKGLKSVEMTSTKTDSCEAEVEMDKNENRYRIFHSNNPCPTGAQIFLKVPLEKNLSLHLNGGVISVKNSKKLTQSYQTISAKVSGGVIQSQISEFRPESKYGKARLEFNNENSNKNRMTLLVNGGVIRFEK
ncbi:MAG: hypothetical protein CL678_16175 [Bdellovibrionaceae bacterium]|nr:hypothetical protein [Pseudobdellovibrionaceae bacterium]|tara:strand:+ start:4099 stop:4590 length:492 start_codon:yes stop_codon:yes gene_type:complete